MNNPPNLLIIDDSKDIRLLLQSILKKAGYQNIVSAESAKAAFAYLGIDGNKSKSDSKNFDLILMDILMPEIDGIEACKRIKKLESLRDIPIIMVTAQTDVSVLQQAFDIGVIDYIIKPINKIELLARIRSVLKLKKEMDRRKELVIKLEEANRKLKKLSSIDGLTGIANRRIFDEFLNNEWKRALRNQKQLSLIMIDIDFFKKYNDTYGHQAGDDCLKQVAKTLSGVLKRPGDLAARYGGEEFVVILPDTNSVNAKKIGEKARTEIEALNMLHKNSEVSNRVTISLGTASTTPHRDLLVEDLIQAADKALYRAKHEGRNRLCAVDLMQ